MAHLDNPEKAQYDVSGIKAHGGVDLAELLRPSSSQRYDYIREMIKYVKEHGITEFQDLMDMQQPNALTIGFRCYVIAALLFLDSISNLSVIVKGYIKGGSTPEKFLDQ